MKAKNEEPVEGNYGRDGRDGQREEMMNRQVCRVEGIDKKFGKEIETAISEATKAVLRKHGISEELDLYYMRHAFLGMVHVVQEHFKQKRFFYRFEGVDRIFYYGPASERKE